MYGNSNGGKKPKKVKKKRNNYKLLDPREAMKKKADGAIAPRTKSYRRKTKSKLA